MDNRIFINTWQELGECESETHVIELEPKYKSSGFVYPKDKSLDYKQAFMRLYYLSTHTFYGNQYQRSTEVLQECGFNVQLSNWDDKGGSFNGTSIK